jgi:hypothetical protein
MDERGWTRYRLAQEAGMTRTTVLNFLDVGRSIGSDKLSRLFGVLDLVVVPKEDLR